MRISKDTIACPACGSQRSTFRFAGWDMLYRIARGKYSIYQCEKCEAFFIDPFPSQAETATFYPKNYYSYNTNEDSGFFSRLRKNVIGSYFEPKNKLSIVNMALVYLAKKKFSGIPLYSKHGGRFLDIGCGRGDNLKLLKKYGWDTYGIELDDEAVRYAKNAGLNVQKASLEGSNFDSIKFDSIRIWHVFEHLTDPNGALEKIKGLLADDGEIIMAIPNSGCFARTIFRKYWYGFDVPRHVISYSPKSIKLILSRHGLVCENIIHSSCGSFVGSISNFVRKKFGYNKNLIDKLFLVALFYPFDIISDFFKKGDTIFLTIKKNHE